jgi:hypothetical protein
LVTVANTAGSALGIAENDDTYYIADQSGGLVIYTDSFELPDLEQMIYLPLLKR